MIRHTACEKGRIMFKKILAFVMVFSLTANAEPELKWIDISRDKTVQVNGLAWFEENGGKLIRLPLSKKDEITPLAWELSLCPSTARVRFKTDSPSLQVKIDHGMDKGAAGHPKAGLALWNMSSIGVSGIDLYMGEPGKTSFWKTSRSQKVAGEYAHVYFDGLERKMREFTLYLPAYAELKSLKIAVSADAKILKPTPYKRTKPIVIYGTSITQGGCASRGSSGFVAQLERRLNSDVVNLGFSGSGCGEPVLAELMTQIDASVYIVDSVANMPPDFMKKYYDNFVNILRKNKPDVPIILMTKIHFADEIFPGGVKHYNQQHKFLFETYNKLKASGDTKVHLFDAGAIIKQGGDHPTNDGIHLTDLGFKLIADELVPFVEKIIP